MAVKICKNPHAEGYNPNSSNNSAEATAAHLASHEVTFEGAVLRLRETNTGIDDDEFALVWDEEQQRTREVFVATTRGWTYHNSASIDASHEVIAKAVAYTAEVRFAEAQRRYAETPRRGYTARAVVKGEGTVEGVIAWVGKDRNRYADINRYGIRVEGRKGLVFRNAIDDDFEFDVPPVSAEDMVEWRATAEHRARGEFSQAQALADQRDPRPDPTAPGTIVDSQEADETGMRLYAVGESFCEESWARGVAEAVVDAGAAEYIVSGSRADGSLMIERRKSAFQALGIVARWAEQDGTLITHDGRGTVRMVREDGAVLRLGWLVAVDASESLLHRGPERPAAVEAQEAPKGAETAVEGPCTHPSECGAQPVGMVRATKTVTGEGGIVGVYCSGHLTHPAETFPEGYVFAYEAVSAPVEAVEGVQGTEGDPVWVARRDGALVALQGLMDGGAGRYRRTVLIEGTDARGMSDTMPTAVARAYLAEEVADGGELSKPGMGLRLLLVRANGARLELVPARGVVPLGG